MKIKSKTLPWLSNPNKPSILLKHLQELFRLLKEQNKKISKKNTPEK